jgi:hypothetical protein
MSLERPSDGELNAILRYTLIYTLYSGYYVSFSFCPDKYKFVHWGRGVTSVDNWGCRHLDD